MSDAAIRERSEKQRWAVPGSSHDRIVRIAKVALPSAVGVLAAFLALAPFDREGDASFILDKNQVDNAPERMRVEQARYTGEDDRGQKFAIVARTAVQRSSDEPIVDIRDVSARLAAEQGLVTIRANQAHYNLDEQRLRIEGPVRVASPDGYRLETRDVNVDLKQRRLSSDGAVEGRIPLGAFSAGRLVADLGERTVILDQRARLKIVQGAVR